MRFLKIIKKFKESTTGERRGVAMTVRTLRTFRIITYRSVSIARSVELYCSSIALDRSLWINRIAGAAPGTIWRLIARRRCFLDKMPPASTQRRAAHLIGLECVRARAQIVSYTHTSIADNLSFGNAETSLESIVSILIDAYNYREWFHWKTWPSNIKDSQ